MIMVRNPVAQVNNSTELPNLTEHVPVVAEEAASSKGPDGDASQLVTTGQKEISADYGGACEIYVPKNSNRKQRKKQPLQPDSVLTDGTDALKQEVGELDERTNHDMHNLVTAVQLGQEREKSYQNEIRKLTAKLARLENEQIGDQQDIIQRSIYDKKEAIFRKH